MALSEPSSIGKYFESLELDRAGLDICIVWTRSAGRDSKFILIPVKSISPSVTCWTVKVQVSKLWKTVDHVNGKAIGKLEMILFDSETLLSRFQEYPQLNTLSKMATTFKEFLLNSVMDMYDRTYYSET
ncbi:hypothetical protein GmHk_17G049130 [Glycine max]|nr:hypothetical protein GmHk_17G049130 [Glycine max]